MKATRAPNPASLHLANIVRVNAVCPGQIATFLEMWRFGLEAQFFGSTIEEC